jgi:hypothetical protein
MNFRIAVLAHPKLKGSAYIPSFPPKRVDCEPGVSQGFITVITDFEKFLVLHVVPDLLEINTPAELIIDKPDAASTVLVR